MKYEYVFKVKRSLFGRLALWYLKKNCFNSDTYKMTLRGRDPNRGRKLKKKGLQQRNYCRDIPVKISKYVGVYIEKKMSLCSTIGLK